ncbi:hypothetical protein GCM10017556_21980 [Micromonospora sagamiensis]|nr:hypothetical protein GCM10017556_21980 [Micromonospora sagamiensis]
MREQHPRFRHPADADRHEVSTLVMSLPTIPDVGLLEPLSGTPVATAPAVSRVDGRPLRLLVVTADLDSVLSRRIRGECGELEAILAGIDPSVVLPIVDHGVDDAGRPYLLLPRPGPELAGPLSLTEVVAAAESAAAGLAALAERGVLGPPYGLHPAGSGGIVLGTPLPPALVELEASLGTGTGLEPPEVLRGEEWTPAAQVYACGCLLWTLLDGRPPYGGGPATLARLLAAPPRMRADVPEPVVDVLRTALAGDPADRPATPAALARALRAAAPPAVAPPAASAGPPVTRQLGSRYLLENRIGSGASGEVWAGRRIADGDRVAVKVLRERLSEDERAVARFLREYRVLLRLRHPHLVRVHDLVVEDGVPAIVMDLVDGEDLHRVAQRGPMPLADAAELLAQTAGGLAAVHAADLVHRDVKPANVLVTRRDGRQVALLSDFGIARAVAGAAHTQPIGTPAYLAPELVAGRPPTPAADVYSLGVTAYELLVGRPPFRADSVDALVRAHLDGSPPRPDGLDDSVWELLAACLAKAPEQRPPAADVAARWAAFAQAGPVGETAAPPPAPSSRESTPVEAPMTVTSARPLREPEAKPPPRRSRRPVVVLAATVVVGLAAGVGLAVRDASPDPPPKPPPVAQPYPVPAVMTLDAAGGGTITWGAQADRLPGFEGYLVLDVSGDRARPVSSKLSGGETSYRVTGLRPGRQSCFVVVAVGVTATPPPDVPPATCTPPKSK